MVARPTLLFMMGLLAASCAVALLSGLMVLLRCSHPPGCSTALIVALGLMPELAQGVALIVAATGVCGVAWVVNRLAGVYYPLWRCPPLRSRDGLVPRALLAEASKSSPEQRLADLASDLVTRRPRKSRRRSPH